MKIKVSSVLDLSRFLSTSAGEQLRGALEYLAQLSEELVTALTSNLSYADNFACEVKRVSLRSEVPTIVKQSKQNQIKEVRIRRIYSDSYFIVDSFGWKYDETGKLIVYASIANNPPIDLGIDMDLIIFYG